MEPESVYDELFEPLALAIGRMVVGAAVLEKALLVDLIQRRVGRDGLNEVLGKQPISQFERLTGGLLLERLRELDFQEDLAEEIAEVIKARNHFVHHLFDDPEFIKAYAAREGIEQIVERVEALTTAIYRAVKRIEPDMTSGAEAMFERSGTDLLRAIKQIDPDEIDDGLLREQFEAIQAFPDDFMER